MEIIKTREELLKAYEDLSPVQQALMQLCAIIYEPVSMTALFKILRRTGLSFPGERLGSTRALDPHLSRLRGLGLLDENYEVSHLVVEIITRRAAAAGRIFNGSELFKGIESEQAWTDRPPVGSRCVCCGEATRGNAQEKMFTTARGFLCLLCAETELKLLAADEYPNSWPPEQVLNALSTDGDIRSRLTVLWRADDLLQWYTDARRKDHAQLSALLVQNLGFVHSHPLARAVRRAALDACCDRANHLQSYLLKMMQKEPWQYYANLLIALGLTAPESPDVQAMFKEAAEDSNIEIRKRVMSVLGQSPPVWARSILEKLSKDKDQGLRQMAALALKELKETRGRLALYRPLVKSTADRPLRPSIRFGPFPGAIQHEMPLGSGHYGLHDSTSCPRILRDLRITVYAQDVAAFSKCLRTHASVCGGPSEDSASLAHIFNNPFDAAWFDSLPNEMQVCAFHSIFKRTMECLRPDADALACAMKAVPFKSMPQAERGPLLYLLATRLLMGGRCKEAEGIISEFTTPDYTGGLTGWLRFLEGKNDLAIELFERDIKELRRRIGKKKANFLGFEGLFYVLALLKARDGALVKRADQLVTWSLSSHLLSDFMASAYRSFKGIVQAHKHELEEAKRLIAEESKTQQIMSSLFNAIAAQWVNGHLSRELCSLISLIFRMAKEAELTWVAAECAALLLRAGKETTICREFLDGTVKQCGLQPVAASIVTEEPWQKGLRAIIEIAGEAATPAAQKAATGMRLVWLVGYRNGSVSLQPLEQKATAKGEWSRGRPVAMNRLFNRTKLEYITRQDQAICASIKHERAYSYYYRYGESYSFDMDRLLPALVGHPLLFLEESPSVPVEFTRGDPEILVARSGSKLRIKFTNELTDAHAMVIQETPTRFKVIELTEKHRRLAQVLGDKGLVVPASAKEEVLPAVAALSRHALVHSDIGGKSEDVVEVESDSTPHVQLVPSGPGFRVEVFVKPFRAGSSPYLKPAVGATNVIAEVDGKRMQVQRDLKAEELLADAVDAASPTLSRFADSDRQCQLEDPQDCLQVLLDLKSLQEKDRVVVEWPEGEKLRVTREIPVDRFRLHIRGKMDWFEVSGEVQVDDNLVLDMKRLLELIQTTNKRFIPLEEGHFLALTKEFRKRLEELDAYAEKKGKTIRLHPLAALAVQDLMDGIPNLQVDEAWKSRAEHIQAAREISPPVPSTLKAELRDYQVEGYIWMARLAHMGIGACLADDMGLGKTLQALSIMLHLAARGPSLVVAPTSVCWNWVTEVNRFAPTLNVMQLGANGREELVKGLKGHDVLVTSYGLLIQEAELLSAIDWNVIVLDEAQAIKNVLTRRSQAAMSLRGSFRIITTGTPIENHLGEFWTLFNFINPGLLGSPQRFNERFAVPIEKYNNREARKRLKRLIQPFILRRLKSQVLEELPPRTEVVLQVEMSAEETAFYEALRRQSLARIEADDSPIAQKHLKILAEITRLRQAACNPRLILSESPPASSKLELFGQVVSELLENRHKALVFSQFVGHLSLIREYLDSRNITYRYLDGSTPPKERTREVNSFQSGEGDLFLISLKAGGLGLNLTAADYVILMDPWWNPAVEDQASDRAHRIGQQHPVTIYRLVTKNTIEEKILKLHQEKRDLAGSLLDGSDISGKISAEELMKLIREDL